MVQFCDRFTQITSVVSIAFRLILYQCVKEIWPRHLGTPAATFLGLTPVGWAVAGTAATLVATLGYFITRKTMRRINEEREKGGLEPITLAQIIKEVRHLETQSLETILARLDSELNNVSLSSDHKDVSINGQRYSLHRLKYVVNKDGSEEIVFVTKTGRKKRVLLVRAASGQNGTAC
ncbi:MAG: hypothetical protein P8Q92_13105 [Pseudoprimorskyibacter sp.]|nr:hypothetical protein [Pseudoprimorskyibacter sp.]